MKLFLNWALSCSSWSFIYWRTKQKKKKKALHLFESKTFQEHHTNSLKLSKYFWDFQELSSCVKKLVKEHFLLVLRLLGKVHGLREVFGVINLRCQGWFIVFFLWEITHADQIILKRSSRSCSYNCLYQHLWKQYCIFQYRTRLCIKQRNRWKGLNIKKLSDTSFWVPHGEDDCLLDKLDLHRRS